MLALTSLRSGDRSVGIVRLWTEAMEFFFIKSLKKGAGDETWCFQYKHLFTPVLRECIAFQHRHDLEKKAGRKSFVMTLRYELSSVNVARICDGNRRILFVQ
jgi:hypothetical protein